jgi:hypothetical protein
VDLPANMGPIMISRLMVFDKKWGAG